MLQTAAYNAAADIAFYHLREKGVMMNISRVPRKRTLYRNDRTDFRGKRAMWSPQQKYLSWLRDKTRDLGRGRDSVMTFSFGTCIMAKMHTLFHQAREFAGCKLDSDVLRAAESDFSLTFGLEVLSPNFDTGQTKS